MNTTILGNTGSRGERQGGLGAVRRPTARNRAGAASLALALVLSGGPGAASAAGQEPARRLDLEEAVTLALERNPGLAEAEASARAEEAGADAATAFLWPTVGLEAGLTSSDDPVAVFGGKLRQGTFSEADFATERLVDPDALDDWTAGAGAEWNALDPSRWATLDAARTGADAARLAARRARQATVWRARVLYVAALEAEAAADAAEAATEAARATAALLERRRDEGLLTDADALRAQASLAAARARSVRAEQAVDDARRRLAVHLGLGPGERVEPTGSLEEVPGGSAPGPSAAAEADPSERADVAAARRAAEAADAGVRAARAARLPTAAAFARLARHAPGAFDDGRSHLTAGIRVSVPVFTGFEIGARVREAEARRAAAESRHRALLLEAAAQVDEARGAVSAAERALEASRAAARSAREALRLVRRRFEEGMATSTDLLQAQARSAEADAAEVAALGAVRRARATLDFVRGDDPAVAGAVPTPTPEHEGLDR